jgi:nitronate monooxygenase
MEIPQIVLAPLAGGPFTPELAGAVSNAGGLGFVAAGYLTAEAFAERLAQTRALTGGQIGANLFVLSETPVDEEAVERYARELEPEARARGVELGRPCFDDDELDAKLDAVVDAQVEVVSMTFGCLPAAAVARLQRAGCAVWATVTSIAEAEAAQTAGADALVLQGAEAGGHSAAWEDDGDLLPLAALLAALRGLDLPLVATGGLFDRVGVRAVLEAGAAAAQAGSAFLLCPEAGTSEPHRRALAAGGETALTRAFTGRRGRGIVNGFMRAHPDAPAAYPHINHLTAPLRAAARAAGDADGFNLWAGTSHAQAQELPAAEVVARLRA